MSKPNSADLEKVFAAAFERAEGSRVAAGMTPRKKVPVRKAPDGRRYVGPRAYRLTLWLKPWEYLDLLEEQRRASHKGNLLSFVVSRATSGRTLATAKPRARHRLRAVA